MNIKATVTYDELQANRYEVYSRLMWTIEREIIPVAWTDNKRYAITNYLRRWLEPKTYYELMAVNQQELERKVNEASLGYDRYMAKRKTK